MKRKDVGDSNAAYMPTPEQIASEAAAIRRENEARLLEMRYADTSPEDEE